MKIFNKIIGGATKITNKFKTPQQEICTQVCPRVYHCIYPSNPKCMQAFIKNLAAQQMQIWNLSQYRYSKQVYQKLNEMGFAINEVTYQFYSSMPLTTSITAIDKISRFIKSSQHNYVFIHCQQNKSRSALFLAAYLYLSGKFSDVATALAQINQKIKINSNETVYSSQHSILRNIANYHRDPQFINKQQLKLLKVIINEAPKLPSIEAADDQLMILVQIRRNAKVVYKKLTKQFGQGQIVKFDLKNQDVKLSDDCLFSFKYVYQNKIYPVMRIQLNTNFIFNCFLRVQMQQIDFCHSVKTKNHIFTDFLFSPLEETQSQLSKLNHKILTTQSIKKQTQLQKNNNLTNYSEKNEQKNKNDEVRMIQGQKQMQKNIFHINDQKQKQELNQQATFQKIKKLLDSMAKNKAQLEQDQKEASYQQINQNTKNEDQTKIAQVQNNQKQVNKQQKYESLQITKQKTETKQNETGKKQAVNDDNLDVDIDDYLSKLEQQAEQI